MSLTPAATQTAATILTNNSSLPAFSSGSSRLDSLLTPHSLSPDARAGLPSGSTLELYGPPGIGKSRALLGFLLQSRFRALDGDAECVDWSAGQALVCDCQGSLGPELIHSTALSYAAYARVGKAEAVRASQGIHYRRITDQSHLTAFLHSLADWLSDHPEVNLVLIDGLSAYIRQTSMDIPTRTMLFALVTSTVTQLRHKRVTLIATSQVQTKMVHPDGAPSNFGNSAAEGVMISQLAEAFQGKCWRVALYYDDEGERIAHLVSSPVPSRNSDTPFAMDALGPCDHPNT